MFRRSGDVLDLTDLQRRGLFKVKESEKKSELPGKVNAQGYFELSGSENSSDSVDPIIPKITPEPPSSFSTDPFSALDNASASNSDTSAFGFLDSLATASSANPAADNLELQGLKNKIEDLEYKLERLMEKIAKLEETS